MEPSQQPESSQTDQTQPTQSPEQPEKPQQPQPDPLPEQTQPPQPAQPEGTQQPQNPPQPEQQSPLPPPQQPTQPQFAQPPPTYQQPEQSQPSRRSHRNRYIAVAAIVIIACSLFAGVAGFYVGNANSSSSNSSLQKQITNLQNEVASLSANGGGLTQEVPENVSLSTLYNDVKDSVVVITDIQSNEQVEGSGFIDDLSGRMVVVTNDHVVDSGTDISVTFSNGDGYAATVLGSDPYADLAVLSVDDAPASEFHPLQIVNSTTLSVGDFVAAVGSPFGLSGSITTGIVSALGRTITESSSGNYPIADVIQFSAPINPGNSGGPLLNSAGQVVGINTAGIENDQNGGTAQGVGFAISSDTILREINSLADTGSYSQYPYMGVSVVDNSYDIANQAGLKVTYGLLVETVASGGPADKAGIKAGTTTDTIDGESIIVGGDVITAINGVRIINEDQLSTYLAENTLPGQTISVTILRGNQILDISLVLGTRPAAS